MEIKLKTKIWTIKRIKNIVTGYTGRETDLGYGYLVKSDKGDREFINECINPYIPESLPKRVAIEIEKSIAKNL